MPRPKSITWEKRVQVFLAYRQSGGKVNPVANRYGIARSTVSVIVKEFIDMGFSERPRAKVSGDLLNEMQQQHIVSLLALPRLGIGRLKLGPGNDNERGRQEAIADPLPIQEESRWHLKGTRAERIIEEATIGIRDYLKRESEAWQSLHQALEEACQLAERDGEVRQDPEPHLLPALKRRVRNAFVDGPFLAEPPPPSWLRWDLEPDQPEVLTLQGELIGIGSAEDHNRIKEGVAAFLPAFQKHQRSFLEVQRLRQDMGLMDGILDKEVQAITGDDVRRGICPTCPYPEASLEPNAGPIASKRRADEE